MILAGDVKPGTKIINGCEPCIVTDVVFVKPGKGGAFARVKMKNMVNNLMREVTYRTEEKIEQPDMRYVNVAYMYDDGNFLCFMDQESFEEIFVDKKIMYEKIKDFLRDQERYVLLFWNEKIIDVAPPIHMELQVIDTTPGVRGDSSQSPTKSATLETGMVVQVPLFVAVGDLLKIDTRSKEYVERIKK